MAHFAKLDDNNIVINVHRVNNNELLDENGVEQEAKGLAFLIKTHGHTNWKQCSYNTRAGTHKLGKTPLRKNYAGVGMTYDEGRDAFIHPNKYPSFVLNETTCRWENSVPEPETYTQQITDLNDVAVKDQYEWDEASTTWRLFLRVARDIRKNYTGKPYTIDPATGEATIGPQPYPSWIRPNEVWEAPTACPVTYTQNRKDYDDNAIPDGYAWNETTKEWNLTSSPSA